MKKKSNKKIIKETVNEEIKGNWLEDIHIALAEMDAVKYNLYDTAAAFGKTGNVGMQSFLFWQADIISNNSKNIRKSLGEFLSVEVRKGQLEISQTFKMILDSIIEPKAGGKCNDKMDSHS